MTMRATWMGAWLLAWGCAASPGASADGGPFGGRSDGAPSAEGTAFLTEYCETLLRCCTQAGLERTIADCRRRLPLGAGTHLPPTVVADCRAALAAARDAPDFCDRGAYHYLAGSGCTYALLPPQGGAPLGAPCENAVDCASSASAEVLCQPTLSGDAPMGRCIAVRRGALGEGPCVRTGVGFVDEVNPIDVAERVGVVCRAREGLRCDPETDTCVALGAAGSACVRDQDCLDQHVCRGSVCVARAALGASCADIACTLDAFCDPATQRCSPKGVARAPCAADVACHSGICRDGSCLAQPQTIEFGLFCAPPPSP